MKKYSPYIIYALLALSITLPFFAPGYIFLLDMVWGPNMQIADMPENGISAHFPLMILIKALSFVLPVEMVQKILLASILFLAGFLMHKLSSRFISEKWAILSGIFYTLNPWVFERFLAGHWLVLLGYAYFPFAILKFRELLEKPSRGKFLIFTAVFSFYPILSLHWWYISIFFLSLMFTVHLYLDKKLSFLFSRLFAKLMGIFLAVISTVNLFWLAGFFSSGNTFEKITLSDFKAFQTGTDPDFGVFFNVLSLYGFWNNSNFLPKDLFAFWWVVSILILVISFLGVFRLLKNGNRVAIAVMIIFFPALFAAVGYGNEYSKKFVDFLCLYLPGFRGLRETEKIAGLLAFSYAFCLPFGAKSLARYASRGFGGLGKKLSDHCAFLFVLIIALMSAHNMFWGFSGAVKPYEYPASWLEAEKITSSGRERNKILFLPWHGYPKISFAGNVMAGNPAGVFFSSKIISGKNLDNVFLLETEQGIWDRKIFNIVQRIETVGENTEFLRSEGVDFIVLAKFSDWNRYGFLNEAEGLEKVYDSPEIAVWKVL